MTKRLIVRVLVLAAVLLAFSASSVSATKSRSDVPYVPTTPAPTATSVPRPVPHPVARSLVPWGWPVGLQIPRYAVKAPMEYIDLQSEQDHHAPFNWNDVAWFYLGARPGERGRAVIFGHLDSTCCPAVFWHLKDLNAGDTVTVQYPRSKALNFHVMWRHAYPNDKFPLDFALAKTKERGLLLATCTGTFHRDGTGYDQKMVVYARLIMPNGSLG